MGANKRWWMTLSGIWDSYFYDASHTIREPGCYINTIKIEYLSLVWYPCDTSLHVCHSTILIIFCTFGEIQTHILRVVTAGSILFNYEGMLGVWWVSIPLPSVPQTDVLPIELHTPYSTDKGYRTQWHPGYEPGPKTFSIGICGRHWNRTKYPKVHLA